MKRQINQSTNQNESIDDGCRTIQPMNQSINQSTNNKKQLNQSIDDGYRAIQPVNYSINQGTDTSTNQQQSIDRRRLLQNAEAESLMRRARETERKNAELEKKTENHRCGGGCFSALIAAVTCFACHFNFS